MKGVSSKSRSSGTLPNADHQHNSRYSARYLILIYPETRANFDPLEIQRLVAREQAQCTIVRQSQDYDNVPKYFAFVDFSGKRFQTRNLGLFDVQGYHPKWIHVTSSPWRAFDEMIAQGDVLWNGIGRPKKQSPTAASGRKKPASTSKTASSPSSSPWELIGSTTSETSFQELLTKEITIGQSETPSSEPLFNDFETGAAPLGIGGTEMSRNVQFWQDGYRVGYNAAISQSNIHQNIPNTFSTNNTFPSSDSGDFDDSGQSHVSTDGYMQAEFSQLDWNLDLDDIWNHQQPR